jgi:hypothetical protein
VQHPTVIIIEYFEIRGIGKSFSGGQDMRFKKALAAFMSAVLLLSATGCTAEARNSKAREEMEDSFGSYMDKVLAGGSTKMDTADKFIYIIDYLIDYVSKDLNYLRFMSKHLSWGLFAGSHHTVQYHSDEDKSPVIDFVAYVGKMLEADDVTIRNPRLLIFTLLELVSSTCYDVILYSEPMPLDEFKPHLNRTIRLLVNDAIIQ